MGKFIRHSKSRSLDLLSAYDWCVPSRVGELLILAVLFIVGMLLGGAVMAGLMALSPQIAQSYGMVIVYPVQFIPVMLYASARSASNKGFVQGISVDNSNFAPLKTPVGVIAALLSMVGVAFMIDPLGEVLPPMDEKTKAAMTLLTKGPLWVTLLSTAVFAPFFEEWLLRGMVLRGLLQKIKPVWAILISAVLFGLIHGNIWQAIPATILGALLGWVYYKTGSLKLTMLMHCANNSMSVMLTRLIPESENYESMLGMMKETALGHYAALYLAAIVACAIGIWTINKIKTATPKGSCEVIEDDMSEI